MSARQAEWVKVGEAARILQVNKTLVKRWVDTGVLEARIIPGRGDRQILRASVDQLLIDMREAAIARADAAEVAS